MFDFEQANFLDKSFQKAWLAATSPVALTSLFSGTEYGYGASVINLRLVLIVRKER